LAPTVRTRRHCLSPDMAIPTRESETGNGYLAGSDGHAALKARRAKCHCQTSRSSRRDAEVAVLDSHFPKDRGIVMKSPSGTNVEVVRSHSRAVAE
jgi:hypothetical protein